MTAHRVGYVIAKLVFLLISQHGKRGNSGDELIVAVSFKSRDRAGGRGERKCQRKALRFVTRLRQVQAAGVQYKSPKPILRKRILLAEHQAEVVVVRGHTRGWQRSLLHQSVVLRVSVQGAAQEPVRIIRLRPVEPGRRQIIAKWNRNVVRYSDAGRARNQPSACQLRKRVELLAAGGTLGDAGVLGHI